MGVLLLKSAIKVFFIVICCSLLVLTGCEDDVSTGAKDKDDVLTVAKYNKVPEGYKLPKDVMLKEVTDFKTLKDGEKVVKKGSKEMYVYPKQKSSKPKEKEQMFVTGATIEEECYFKITSSTPILEVGDFTITKEWEYKATGWNYENITSNCKLHILNNKKIFFYEGNNIHWIEYPYQLVYWNETIDGFNITMDKNIRNLTIMNDYFVQVSFYGDYDPMLGEFVNYPAKSDVSPTYYDGGIVYWPTDDGDIIVRNWSSGTFGDAYRQEATNDASKARYISADYSIGKDVGLWGSVTEDGDFVAFTWNMTTGTLIDTYDSDATTGTASSNAGTVILWNGTNEGMIFYENSVTNDHTIRFHFTNETSIGSAQSYTFPSSGSGSSRYYNVDQINSTHLALSFWFDPDDTIYFFTWEKDATTPDRVFVIESNTMNRDQDSDMFVTNDGQGVFIGAMNRTANCDQSFVMAYINLTSNTTSYPSRVATEGACFIQSLKLCPVPNYPEQAVLILADQFSNTDAVSFNSQGTIIDTISKASSTNKQTDCFVDYYNNVTVLLYGDANLGKTVYYNGTDFSESDLDNGDSFDIGTGNVGTLWHTPTPDGATATIMTIDSNSDLYAGAYWNITTLSVDNDTSSLINDSMNGGYSSATMYFIISRGEDNETTDSCTYNSGNHTYECSDSCVLSSDVNVDEGSLITINGTGTFTGLRYIKGAETIRIQNGCTAKA